MKELKRLERNEAAYIKVLETVYKRKTPNKKTGKSQIVRTKKRPKA